MYRKAFTLAEVLIVLGIIGIVAAMTIPTLMTKIQDREFKIAAKKAYSVTQAAMKQMNYDNGTDNFDYKNTGETGPTSQALYYALKGYYKLVKDKEKIFD